MRFLVTNDDGISAPGIEALAGVARQLGHVRVVAPVAPCSGISHQVTTHRPLRLAEHGPDEFAVEGTPADCVRVGLAGRARMATEPLLAAPLDAGRADRHPGDRRRLRTAR